MPRTPHIILFSLGLLAAACDGPRGPRLALATQPGSTEPGATERAQPQRHPGGAPTMPKGPTVYGGKTAEQWAQDLQSTNREQIAEACRALHVMGREGREYLFQGLDSANPETRRLCLEVMTIAGFKKKGDAGRAKLVKLSGDRDDVRIRERAAMLLRQWHGSIPAP
jgi:hypothetical protein